MTSRGASSLAFIYWFANQAQYATVWVLFRDAPESGTLVRFATTALLFAAALLVSSREGDLGSALVPAHVWLVSLFLAWSGLSIFWTPSPLPSFGYWANLILACTAVFALIYSTRDVQSVVRASFAGLAYGSAFLGGIVLLTLGSSAVPGMILGDAQFLHPNVVGNQLAIGALACAYLITVRPATLGTERAAFGVGAFLVTMTLLTLSKTSIVALCIAGFVYLVLGMRGIRQRLGFTVASTLIAVGLMDTLIAAWARYTSLGNGRIFETLSGRTVLWEMVQRDIGERPIVGHGIYSYRFIGPQPFEIQIGSAHNEALNLLFNFGVVGTALVALIWVSLIVRCVVARRQRENRHQAAVVLSMLVYFAIRGITEADPVASVMPLPLFLLMARACAASPATSGRATCRERARGAQSRFVSRLKQGEIGASESCMARS